MWTYFPWNFSNVTEKRNILDKMSPSFAPWCGPTQWQTVDWTTSRVLPWPLQTAVFRPTDDVTESCELDESQCICQTSRLASSSGRSMSFYHQGQLLSLLLLYPLSKMGQNSDLWLHLFQPCLSFMQMKKKRKTVPIINCLKTDGNIIGMERSFKKASSTMHCTNQIP